MTSSFSSWEPPSACPQAGDDAVHVWRVELSQSARIVKRLLPILSSDEHARAERFRFQKHRNQFIIARGTLRIILARYLQSDPDQLEFGYGPYGKPALAGAHGKDAIRFNLTHSHELALYAVVGGRELGIDAEWVREDFASEQIANRFFSKREVAMLRSLPASQRTAGFFNCWTRKEAYIKAVGRGLSLPLGQFDVSLAPGEPAVVLETRDSARSGSIWSLHELSAGPGYAA